ncbi:arginine-tRNA-protein transferase [Chiua virens]|nr:arginine-tRNA-protein transferase [Chiua virens]
MNLARHSITPTAPIHIFNAQFDADCYFAREAQFTGGTLAAVVPCHTSSLLFLLGGGRSPLYPPNKVILWDDVAGVETAELEFRERVRGIACRRGWLAVALRRRVVVFEVHDTVVRRSEHDTCDNPRGILAMATAAYATLLAIPGRQMGHVQLVHLPPCVPPTPLGPPPSVPPSKPPPPPPLKHPVSMIAAHESALTTLSGTLVRIWDTTSGKLIREFRRGADTAEIYGVAFRPDEKEVGVWSDKGTVHVFSLVPSASSNRQSSLSPLTPFLPLPKYFDSEWSYAQYRIPAQAAHISLSSTSARSSHTDIAADEKCVVVVDGTGSHYLPKDLKLRQAPTTMSPTKSQTESRQPTPSVSSVTSLPEKGKGKEREKDRKGSRELVLQEYRNYRNIMIRFDDISALKDAYDIDWDSAGFRKLYLRLLWTTCYLAVSEREFLPGGEEPRHDFQVTLERSSFTDEKYALFVAYQTEIHHDDDNTPRSFRRFLVQSPLISELIPYPTTPPQHLPSHFGSYHQMYRLDGELIAVGVLDILPGCVSSVYFMYNAKWEKFSLGKLSALREASLAREIHDAGLFSLNALYMGFYIHSCPKMRYKGEYSPSFLADPEDFKWYPLKNCVKLLDKYRYAVFSQPDHSLAGTDDPGEAVEVDDEEELARNARSIYSIQGNTVSLIPATMSRGWNADYTRQEIVGCVRALGAELLEEIIFRM